MATVVELNGSGKVRLTASGRSGTRIFHVTPYAQAEAWAAALLGRTAIVTNGSPIRTPGAQYSPGSQMYASTADVEGLGACVSTGGNGPDYDGGARVTVQYETMDFDQQDQGQSSEDDMASVTWLTEDVAFSTDAITLNPDDWEWLGTLFNEPLEDDQPAPGILVPRTDWTLTRRFVPVLDRKTITGAVGKVNSKKVLDFEAETLLFLGANARRTWDSQSTPTWEVVNNVSHKEDGWNKFFRSKTGEWSTMVNKSDPSKKPFKTIDFTTFIPELSKVTK